uniref:Uncharacterized protein n=1 Tax=Amphimedon queenslandica TaxID=400682 RepID=A0A1X7V3K9_AMPQE
MIDVTQWRAAIGHWNSSRLRLLTPATGIDGESLMESINETFKAASAIKPADIPTVNITADLAAAVTHITTAYSASSTGSDSTPNPTAEVSTKETMLIYKGMLLCDTVSYAVYLLLYFMLLLLLSGDVELNPGPITVEQVRSKIDESLLKHFADIEKATEYCIDDISSKLYSKSLITESVKKSPTYHKIVSELKAGMSLLSDVSQVIERYETFLECLSCDGGPAKDAVDSLTSDWKDINKQCDERLQTFRVSRTSEEEIKHAVSSLNSSFAKLLKHLKEELKDTSVSCIIEHLNDAGYTYLPLDELKTSSDTTELINKLNKYYDFLDCDVLETIATEFTTPTLSQEFLDHSKAAEKFRESKSVEDLKEFLQEIFSPHIHNLADAPKAHIRLQNVWRELQLHKLRTLIKCFFPTCDRLALTKAISITCSSVHITYFMTESPKEIEDLILLNREKLAFMKYIGVYELCINGVTILQSTSDKSFNFDTALLEAAQAKQAEVIEFILKIEFCSDAIITKSMENILITLHFHKSHNDSIIEILINKYSNNLYKRGFILAAQKGFIEIVLEFLQKEINPNTQDNDGWTALILASQNGHQQVVELLLKEKADPTIQKNNGATALNLASQNGHQQVVELLLNEKAVPNIQDNDGWTALMLANLNGHQQVVELLLNEKADPNIQHNDGWTALMLASQNGHQQVVELLLNEKADPNVQDNDGRTALLLACDDGYQQVVELLLNEKADPNIQDNNGWTALMLASKKGHQQVVELLLNKKADPNIQHNDGWTALMFASKNGHQQVVELLLNEKVDPNIQDNDGRTALLLACDDGYQQVVELLLREKADPNIQDNDGWTALIAASQNGHQQVVELLLNERTDPNIQHNDGWTALMFASRKGHQQVVELLLNEKADPNIQKNNGATALMAASANGHQQVIELLLNENADPTIQNNNGWTALMIASANGHQQVVELLLNEKTDGRSELMAANKNGHQQVVELRSATKCKTSNEEKIEGQTSHQQNTSQHDVTDNKKNQDKHTRLINDDEKPEFHKKIKDRAINLIKMGSLISESIRNPFKGKIIVEKRNIIYSVN